MLRSWENEDVQLTTPDRIAVIDDYCYVVDTGGNQIQVFDLNGKFIRKFGDKNTMNCPRGITSFRDELFIVSYITGRIGVYH